MQRLEIADQIGYELEICENVSVSDIQESFSEGVLIWAAGSATGEGACWRMVLEYRGHAKYIERNLPDKTVYQAMLLGLTETVRRMTRPMRIYVISAATLGFAGGLRGKGANAAYFADLFAAVIEQQCTLTEVQLPGGSEMIRKYMAEINPDKHAVQEQENRLMDKQLRYKEAIYRECIAKVLEVLGEYRVDNAEMLRKIRDVHPT